MAAEQRGLIRILGVGFGLAVIVGSTLGIGILRTPGLVAAQLDSPSSILTVWLAVGLYTLLGSLCLTELGTMLPQAGGYYVYARRAFGDTVGFAVGWSDWITYCAVLGYVTIAIGEFSAVLVPSLDPAVKLIAVAALILFALLQWAGVRISSRFQEATTAVKFLAFLALVAACFAHAASSSGPGTVPAALRPAGRGLVGVVVALQSVAITYGGWQSALYFTEEDRDPRRNLPRSMIGGVLSVLVIYLLVNLALLSVLPLGVLSSSTLPAADAAKAIFGGRGGQLITLLSLVSLPPLVNAILMIGTRILFAMGRDGLLWRGAAVVNDRGTPVRATLVTTVVAAVLIASGTFQKLVAVASFFLALNYCICCLALIVLRRREPGLERPFRAWGYPWSAAIVLAGAAAFLVGVLAGDTQTALVAFGLLAAGLLGRMLLGDARNAREGGSMTKTAGALCVLAVTLAGTASHAAGPTPLDPLRFLIGEWQAGANTGPHGQGSGHFAFALDLQDKIIVRTNHAEYPGTTADAPARHDDLIVIYAAEEGGLQAHYYDNEGHMIHYVVTSPKDGEALFLGDVVPGAPRFKLTYSSGPSGVLRGVFWVAPPGQPEAFTQYLSWESHRR